MHICLKKIILLTLVFFASFLLASPSHAQTETTPTIGILDGLFSSSTHSDPNPLLEPELAFALSSEVNGETISLHWQVAEGYYLYQEKVSVELVSPKNLTLAPISFPVAKEKHDEIFGDTLVYYNTLSLTQSFNEQLTEPTTVSLNISFQGCADIGVCYPPMQQKITHTLLPSGNETTPSITPTKTSTQAPVSEQDKIADALSNDTFLLTIITFLGFGLLLALTPCVFPMIPILSGIIIGQGERITTRHAFWLSTCYVLASSVTYAIFGVLAGLFGSNLQATFQNPWVLTLFSGLFVLLALSMFGFYQLQLPSRLQTKLHQLSEQQKHGSMVGSAIMGALSALIVGPCVAAPLAGVLIYIGQTGDAVLGGSALFFLGIGMGIPLILMGTSAGKYLPQAGAWMEPIKAFFGVMLLAVAIWLMSRILPDAITLALWGGLLIVSAIYLNALERLEQPASGWARFKKGIGVLCLLYGSALFVGALSGGHSVLQPLANFQANSSAKALSHGLNFQPVKTVEDFEAVLAKAEQNNQTVMLDFYADWCVSCKEMEAFTFTNQDVQNTLSDVVLVQADVTANDEEDQRLLKKFKLIGPPAILFFKNGQAEMTPSRVVGYMPAQPFLNHIQAILSS